MATISDVAAHAGVSKSTVSAVLNDRSVVKDSTRRLVLRAIKELNYRPSPSARRGFRPVAVKTITFVVKEAQNPYYAEVLAGIREVVEAKGYLVTMSSSEGRHELEQRIVDQCLEREADGVIITPCLSGDADLSHIFELRRNHLPFALLEDVRGLRANLVDCDNVQASCEAVQHLIGLGHARIIHLAGPDYSQHSQERTEGVRRAFSESHLIFERSMIVPAGDSAEEGYRIGLEYFGKQGNDRPTAVTCYNDLVTLGLLRALRELGLRVPDDVSVVGFDDLEILRYYPLRLTTVHVPKYEMGRRAAELVMRQIESGEESPVEKVFLQAKLVVRESTRGIGSERGGASTAGG